ncbi:unnamed protein product [Effrenium voratum]|nr:unnamed protein product [Effrenium voratum]
MPSCVAKDDHQGLLAAEEAVSSRQLSARHSVQFGKVVLGVLLLVAAMAAVVLGRAPHEAPKAVGSQIAYSERELSEDEVKENLIRKAFGGSDFLWSVATSAYQVEGAWNEGGRSPSIWDTFTHQYRAYKGSNADVACDHYHRYKEDLALITEYGFKSYRFSISWTRVMPLVNGTMRANPEGVKFYKNVLAELKQRGIVAMVTMFHWDLPEGLDWRNANVVDHFLRYVDFLWTTFPEVNSWITFNEPFTFCFMGYKLGLHAPGVQSQHEHLKCGHNVLRAHAFAMQLFRRQYFRAGLKVGIVLNYDFPFPKDPKNPHDVDSVEVDAQKRIGWFADPLYKGDYPQVLKDMNGENLPSFTLEEKQLLREAVNPVYSFYGLNSYGGRYMEAFHNDSMLPRESFYKDGQMIGQPFIKAWFYKVPEEILLHLRWVNDRYQPGEIIITENGCSDPGDNEYGYTVDDWSRISYYRDYLAKVAQAKLEGVPITGYTAWALMDNFEWGDGYKRRFGLTYVDFGSLKRTPKKSAWWFKNLMQMK